MSPADERIRESLGAASNAYWSASRAFFEEGADRIGILRRALRDPGIDSSTALGLMVYLPLSERIQLFEIIIHKCRDIKCAHLARRVIASLPRDWVIDNIENAVQPEIARFDDLDYSLLLAVYDSLDKHLAMKLAQAAAVHSDCDVREVGEEFLKKLFVVNPELS
jgi:hypothetical protein